MLDFSIEETSKNRILEYERRKNWGRFFSNVTLEEIKIETIVVKFNSVKDKFNIKDHFVSICIDNMVLLGLLKYEEPEVEIENGGSSGEIVIDL